MGCNGVLGNNEDGTLENINEDGNLENIYPINSKW